MHGLCFGELALVFEQMLAAPGCPAIPVIDPIEAADSLLHRERYFARLSEAIENHHPGTCQWTIPNSATIKTAGTPKADNVDALRVQLASSHVKLPVVCKFVGLTTDAHQMAIASTVAGLAEFVAEAPVGSTIVAQQFVNHGGVLHKIFVIGSAVHDVQRKSIRDLSDKDTETGLVRFDSSTISKATSTSPLHQAAAAAATTTATTTARSISVNTLQRLAQEVGDCLQLSLFGIDVVIDSDTGENVVIDVNYFPGYVGMPNVPEHVVRLVEARCRK
ncbi:hypothetical protein, variant [Capsaspora owczarzaki ATCC 30864]|uniref:inositol-1,3,4-trisphosphate 5/6-kinase n=1 Tax=Capsaspora owczarzaki (strain ATCC 30864) TaxID=595528 RepID=A0A0D2X550_CAPO3|nr:hypothetical protein, variant [Capsaspora owczarzaki ATCC 30864]